MITIHKYQFEIAHEFEIEMPLCAMILSVQENQGKWCMWARVDTDLPFKKRKFVAYWTGEKMPNGYASLNYIATIQDYYVWHLYEQVNQLNPAKGAVTNTMNNQLDPNAIQQPAKEEVKEQEAAGQAAEATNDQVQTTEKETESAEEGGTEG